MHDFPVYQYLVLGRQGGIIPEQQPSAATEDEREIRDETTETYRVAITLPDPERDAWGQPLASDAVPRWLDADESPFGVTVFDCRPFTFTMFSAIANAAMAQTFADLRQSDGRAHVSESPANLLRATCALRYPPNTLLLEEGALFRATDMEDKWDIFRWGQHLYFCRSWSGDLIYRARIAFDTDGMAVTEILADNQVAERDRAYALRDVDYLIKRLLYRVEIPHPLPRRLPLEEQPILLYSYAQHGRWASFAAIGDTTRISLVVQS